MTFGRVAIVAWICVLPLGCKEEASPPAPQSQPEAKQEPGPTPEEAAALARAEQEARRRQEEQKKKAAEERRDTCCLALAKKGFELRSSDYIAGKKVCETGRDEETTLDDLRSDIAEAIGDQELPGECLAAGAADASASEKPDSTADAD